MIRLLLNLLEKIPYRTAFGLSLADELKVLYYHKIGQFKDPKQCLCRGKIFTFGVPPDGWETSCTNCDFVFDED